MGWTHEIFSSDLWTMGFPGRSPAVLFDRLHVVSAARSSAERHGTAQMLAGSAPREKAPVQILASSPFSPFIPYSPKGTIMESLFCIAALILIGYLMIAPFFRLRKNTASDGIAS